MILFALILAATNLTLESQPFVYPHIPPMGYTATAPLIMNPSNALLMLPPVEHYNVTTLANILDTNACPDEGWNYISNGICVIVSNCPPPKSQVFATFNPTQSEPTLTEVWFCPKLLPFICQAVVTITNQYYGTNQVLTGTNSYSPWDLYAVTSDNPVVIPNLWSNMFFMIRSVRLQPTSPEDYSAWGHSGPSP